MTLLPLLSFIITTTALASTELPSRYVDLIDYVQVAPDQGESGTCLFVGSTGAMELIANKKHGIKNPEPYGPFDLSESFLIHAPTVGARGRHFLEVPVLKFNAGFGIHMSDWDYTAWSGNQERDVWGWRDWSGMKKVALPKVQTLPLFAIGGKWTTHVLNKSHIQKIKEALWTHKSPVLVNYNDDSFWHVIMIVGYDDDLPGTCYDPRVPTQECEKDLGSFYVRDSFGIPVEVRDYDWFRFMGNAAVVVKEAP